MKKVLLTAVAATLLAPAAHARPRQVSVAHVNAPSHTGSSGSSAAAPASSPVFYGTPPAAAGNPLAGASQALAATSRVAAGGSSRAFSGGRGPHRDVNSGSFWGRRIDEAPTGGSGNGMPSVLMPGQLIRTAGLGAVVSQPDSQPAMHTVEAGTRIAYEDNKGYALTTHQGVFIGPKDTPPPANALFGGGSAGGNGISENVNVNTTNNSHSNNGNGNGNGGGNGGDGGSSGH